MGAEVHTAEVVLGLKLVVCGRLGLNQPRRHGNQGGLTPYPLWGLIFLIAHRSPRTAIYFSASPRLLLLKVFELADSCRPQEEREGAALQVLSPSI